MSVAGRCGFDRHGCLSYEGTLKPGCDAALACIEEKGLEPAAAAIVGTKEIGMAVMATTMSLVIVFLPVPFLSSVTGRMLFQFGVTATIAILVSMLVSFSLTPMMCSKLLRRKDAAASAAPASRGGFYRFIESGYLWMLGGALRFRWLVLVVTVGLRENLVIANLLSRRR